MPIVTVKSQSAMYFEKTVYSLTVENVKEYGAVE